MKCALSYFIGMSTASAFWAAAIFGSDYPKLWVLPGLLAGFSLITAVIISLEEGK